ILLESALFDPQTVRRAARALATHSESSYRFERGIDPALPPRASLRASQMICQIAGGTLMMGLASAGDVKFNPRTLSLRIRRLAEVLGIEIAAAEAVSALDRLEFRPVLSGDQINVSVPSHRL